MIAPRIVSLVVALVLTAPTCLLAQQEPPLAPGDRVRITAVTPLLVRDVCTVVELLPDTLVLDRDGESAFALASIHKLEVSRGRKSHALLGAGIGFAIGFLPMFALCQAGSCGDLDDGVTTCCLEFGVWAGTLTGVVGGLLGSKQVDQWEEVPLDRLRVSITPRRWDRGIAIVASFHLKQR